MAYTVNIARTNYFSDNVSGMAQLHYLVALSDIHEYFNTLAYC